MYYEETQKMTENTTRKNPMKPNFGLDVCYIKLEKAYTMTSGESVTCPEDAVRLVADAIKDLDRENVCVVTFKTNGVPINASFVSVGTLNASMVAPRELMKTAVLSNAASIMMFHNHPSGSAMPSAEDVQITDRVNQCCKLMGITLLDHIIIGANSSEWYTEWYSFVEHRMIKDPEIHYQTDLDRFSLSPAAERKAEYGSSGLNKHEPENSNMQTEPVQQVGNNRSTKKGKE